MGWQLIPRKLSPVAYNQLAAWVKIAHSWDVYIDANHVRCARCGQSVTCLSDRNGVAYNYSAEDQLTLLVAHIRQAHQEMESKAYGSESTQAAGIALDNSGGIPPDSNSPA